MEPPDEDVVKGRDGDDPDVHHHGPVHEIRRGIDSQREKRKDKHGRQIAECADVDGHAEASQGPPRPGQRAAANAPEENAADADVVGGYQGGVCEGCDGVEGHVGAEVDEGQQDCGDEGDEDGIEGDIPVLRDLWK